MLVIGARFRTFAAARAALRAVRASVRVPSGDVAVGPLGSTSYDLTPDEQFLLAGRFEPEDAAAVTAIVHAEGGRVIERRTDLPRSAPAAPTPVEGPSADGRSQDRTLARTPSRPSSPIGWPPRDHARAPGWLRRPSPPLRVRTARGHSLEG